MTACAWTLRDGSGCKQVAQVDGLCPPHFAMRRALETEDRERADRGELPMNERQRERFLQLRRRAQKAARRSAVRESA